METKTTPGRRQRSRMDRQQLIALVLVVLMLFSSLAYAVSFF
jgi:hypothetical protein